MKKIFIIYHNDELIDEFTNQLIDYADSLTFATKFSSDGDDLQKIYMSPLDVKLTVKNNAILYIITRDFVSTGITIDEFYNNDICFLHYDEFNEIPDVIFNKHDILTIWIDSKIEKNQFDEKLHNDLTGLEQRLEKIKYEYFFNDDFEIINKTIYNFLYPDDETEEDV